MFCASQKKSSYGSILAQNHKIDQCMKKTRVLPVLFRLKFHFNHTFHLVFNNNPDNTSILWHSSLCFLSFYRKKGWTMCRRSLKQRKHILSADSEESWRNSAMAAGLYTCHSAKLMSGSLKIVLFVLHLFPVIKGVVSVF